MGFILKADHNDLQYFLGVGVNPRIKVDRGNTVQTTFKQGDKQFVFSAFDSVGNPRTIGMHINYVIKAGLAERTILSGAVVLPSVYVFPNMVATAAQKALEVLQPLDNASSLMHAAHRLMPTPTLTSDKQPAYYLDCRVWAVRCLTHVVEDINSAQFE